MSNETTIQNALHRFRSDHGHKFIAPNVQMPWGEVDLLSVTGAGLLYEHEIKISRADFKADFKHKEFKHRWLENAKALNGRCGHKHYREQTCANYFVYVCPRGLIKLEEIPEYAGLYYWFEDKWFAFGTFEIVKEPPRLHKEKVNVETMSKLARSMMYRYWNYRIKKELAAKAEN